VFLLHPSGLKLGIKAFRSDSVLGMDRSTSNPTCDMPVGGAGASTQALQCPSSMCSSVIPNAEEEYRGYLGEEREIKRPVDKDYADTLLHSARR
jgi:hypothetical protein